MNDVISFQRLTYSAKQFKVTLDDGYTVLISGTLCGHIDVAVAEGCTFVLSPDEVRLLIAALKSAVEDVLANSRPYDDPLREPIR